MLLTVSLVTYHSDPVVLGATLQSLAQSWARVREARPDATLLVCLIDNGDGGEAAAISTSEAAAGLSKRGVHLMVLAGHGNVGYGKGHNLSLVRNASAFHLILNPDVKLEEPALDEAISFLEAHPQAGLLAPYTANSSGTQEFLCKRYPSVFDLALRGFAPRGLRRLFDRRLARYEMRAETGTGEVVWDPPLVSGCFMLFRSAILKDLGGFDPAYFLYFEDYDLSLRTARIARTVFVPQVRIVHYGGGAARKGLRHLRLFLASSWTFFSAHGWRWC